MTPIRLRAVAVLVTAAATLIASAAFAQAKTSAGQHNTMLVRAAQQQRAAHSNTESRPQAEARAVDVGNTCSYNLTIVACHDPSLGWWNSADDCYWNLMAPQPPPGDPLWIGHAPSDGDLYRTTCEQPGGLGIGILGVGVAFSSQPPPGYSGVAGTLNYILAMGIVATLPILGPTIHTAPARGGKGLVGLPVWMWSDSSPLTWGPVDLGPFSVLLLTLSVHALGEKIDWYMGDGHDVVCTTLGTRYTGAASQHASPSCGYSYAQPSVMQPGGRYTITAAVTWSINWTIGIDSGSLSIVRTSTSQLTIDELQVVNQ
jgi:hypothetical protein